MSLDQGQISGAKNPKTPNKLIRVLGKNNMDIKGDPAKSTRTARCDHHREFLSPRQTTLAEENMSPSPLTFFKVSVTRYFFGFKLQIRVLGSYEQYLAEL